MSENQQQQRQIYLAGPMRGFKDWNYPAFYTAEKMWAGRGWTVFNPARMDEEKGYSPETHSGDDKAHLVDVISGDVNAICKCDAIALLPGWEESMGVVVELALAQFLGLTIYDAEMGTELRPVCKPWGVIKNT